MQEDKILSGENTEKHSSGTVLASEIDSNNINQVVNEILSLKERIAINTESGGLKQLPDRFDEQDGDWIVINSSNPFEILYLDYKQYLFLTKSAIVENNYNLLKAFWKNKCEIIGANRDKFEKKYGIRPFEKCISMLDEAYKKLNNARGIDTYYQEINSARIKKGEEQIQPFIRMMLRDGIADRGEIENIIEEGLKFDLEKLEIASIIKSAFDTQGFIPYGTFSGNNLQEKLLSVDSWMTQSQINEAEKQKKEKESLRIQIFPGKYANSIEEIGSILFEDPIETKDIIKEDLLKQVIAQKDLVLAREVGRISKETKNIDAAYLEVIYRLNHNLPFRFSGNKLAKTVEELCSFIFESDQTLKVGKEDLKKGYIEIWLKETNKNAFNNFVKIRDSAENVELAFLEFLHTFNKTLPYRFGGKHLVKTPIELCKQINKSQEDWEAGKKELFNKSILVWLKTTGNENVITKWEKIKNQFNEMEDVGLENFLHLLNDEIEYANLEINQKSIAFPGIQSGNIVTTEIIFTNTTRGFAEGILSFSNILNGISLSSERIFVNGAANVDSSKLVLTIDTSNLLKGINYDTKIQLAVSTGQTIEIPVSFKVVFPKKAFILETAKYAALVSVFFVLIRLLIASKYPDWLNNSFDYYLQWNTVLNSTENFSFFGWSFFLFIGCTLLGINYFIKYLLKK